MKPLAWKLKQIKALKNGEGVQHLFDNAFEILGNPILMHDLECKAIAYTKNIITDDPLWNDFVQNEGHSKEAMEFLKNESIYDTVSSVKTAVILTSDGFKYDRIFAKICNKAKITVAGADLVACNKPLESDDLELFEAFCVKVTNEIAYDKYYENYGEISLDNYFKKLIEEKIEDKGLFTVHVENIYDGLYNYLYLAVVDITKSTFLEKPIVEIRDSFKRIQPEFKYFIYAGYVVIIISINDISLNENKGMKKLKRFFEENNIFAGVSSYFENLFELRRYYEEALKILEKGLEQNNKQKLFYYEDK